ncbi:TPA: hypothetical protein DEP21_01800 [Patescibacteria group bacterium]|nr:hypothetical protein [Candidatus Gracilibacteria bacterium]
MLILIIGVFFFTNPTFAQTTTNTDFLEQTATFLNNLMKFFSWSWIMFAILAGKFMSNDMIYGTWLHLDQYLWQIWNITKNFANF